MDRIELWQTTKTEFKTHVNVRWRKTHMTAFTLKASGVDSNIFSVMIYYNSAVFKYDLPETRISICSRFISICCTIRFSNETEKSNKQLHQC